MTTTVDVKPGTFAQQSIQVGSKNAQEALEAAQTRVGPQMELYCPFTMPEGSGKTGY